MEEREASFRSAVLDALVFEDDQGVWELYWTARSLLPKGSDERAIRMTREVLAQLLREGLVSFFHRPWASGDNLRGALTEEEAALEVAADWWTEIPLHRADLWVSATERAEQLLGKN